MNSGSVVDVFPIVTGAFGLRPDWFDHFAPKLAQAAYLLMVLLLIVSVGIMVLKRFEEADLEKKAWNIPLIVVLVAIWPFVIHGIKGLVDAFNTFLVFDVFQIPWKGFGFPDLGASGSVLGWSAEGVARLLPNLAYWVIYAFYIVYFVFFAVLGPFILAKGILYDEVDSFLELVKELVVLFLWQTTVVVLVTFIMPDIVSGKSFPANPKSNFYFLSLILGIMIFFVPTITRKFANHLGSSIFPGEQMLSVASLGLAAAGAIGSHGMRELGLSFIHGARGWRIWKHQAMRGEALLLGAYKTQRLQRISEHKRDQGAESEESDDEGGDETRPLRMNGSNASPVHSLIRPAWGGRSVSANQMVGERNHEGESPLGLYKQAKEAMENLKDESRRD